MGNCIGGMRNHCSCHRSYFQCSYLLYFITSIKESGCLLTNTPTVFTFTSDTFLFICIYAPSCYPTKCNCLFSFWDEHIRNGKAISEILVILDISSFRVFDPNKYVSVMFCNLQDEFVRSKSLVYFYHI